MKKKREESHTRIKRSVLSFSVGVLRQGLSLALAFLITPLILRQLGPQLFGGYRAIIDIYLYFGVLEFGVYGALSTYLVQAIGKKNRSEQIHLLLSGFRYFAIMGPVIFLLGCATLPFIQYLVPVQEENLWDLRVGFFLLMSGGFLLPVKVIQAWQDAAHRQYHIIASNLIMNTTFPLLGLWAAYQGWGIRGQAGAFLFGTLLGAIYSLYHTPFAWKELRQQYQKKDPKKLKSFFSKDFAEVQWAQFTLRITGQLAIMTDNILVSAFVGPVAVTRFFITQRIFGIIQAQLQGMGGATWAALGEIYAQGNQALFRERVLEITKLISVAAGATLVPMAVLNSQFVSLWVGEKHYGGEVLTWVSAANVFLISLNSFWFYCFSATGLIGKTLRNTIVSSLVNFSVSLFLTFQLGLLGPALGTFLSLSCLSIAWTMVLMERVLQISVLQLLPRWGLPALCSGLYFFAIRYGSDAYPLHGWLDLILRLVAGGLIYGGFAFLLILNQRERRMILGRMKRFFPS